MTTLVAVPTAEAYEAAFQRERSQLYPMIAALEESFDLCVAPLRLERAARVLACPLKPHPPNWQHGRVLYALTRAYLSTATEPVTLLDIGTAKGFSALCLQWTLMDAGTVGGQVVSVDVIDPASTTARNTVAECDGPISLSAILAPWPEARSIRFLQSTGVAWLSRASSRVHVAFVDGKHTGAVVAQEAQLLAARQQAGDLAIFDDVHLPDVRAAVERCREYTVSILSVLPQRAYAIARRR